MMKKRASLVLALMLALSLVLTACGGDKGNQSAAPSGEPGTVTNEPGGTADRMDKPTEAGTLFVGVAGQPQGNFNPLSSRCTIGMYLVYDTLLGYDQSKDEYSMLLAESVEETDDGFLHIKIRDEAKFASGDPVIAEDVLDAFDRCMHSGTSTYVNSTVDLEKSYADGDKDVYIALQHTDMSLKGCMSHMMLSVENASWKAGASDEDYWDKIDGSGPFTVEENVSGSHMLFKVRDDYWGWGIVAERPNYDYLKVTFYSEASTMLVDFESGMLDLCSGLSAADTARIQNNGMEHSQLKILPDGLMYGLILCNYVDAFKDPVVREAIVTAIDVEAVADSAYGDLGVPSNAYAPLNSQYRVEYGEHTVNTYDPDAAKKMLADAGYQDGDIVLNVVTNNDVGVMTMAEIIQEYLRAVGITMNVESYEPSVAIPMFREGKTDLCFNQYALWTKYISSVYITTGLDSTNVSAMMDDTELDAHITAGRFAGNTANAEENYKWIQNWFHENNFMLPLVDTNTAILARDYVNADNVYAPFTWADMRNLDLY